KEVYPEMEMLYILQDRPSRSLFIDLDGPLNAISGYAPNTLVEDLQEFATHFTFVPSGYYK
ncbi:MAG: hypothetical protein COW65_13525, partial [Cytophagales bacterium CG18_big_fil_WC_8_21_14_2_50_42_9]